MSGKRGITSAPCPGSGGRRSRAPGIITLLAIIATLMGVQASAAWASPEAPPNPKSMPTFTCQAVTYHFTGFPNRPGNVVKVKIKVNGVFVYVGVYTFDGTSFVLELPVTIPAGHNEVTAFASWNGNGVKGEGDKILPGGITCAPEPSYSIKKTQEIAGSHAGFTTETLTGKTGQTVDYEITVTNTGNTPLALSAFTDAHCDPGTIGGGPGEAALAIGASTTYTCHHVLGGPGTYENSASVTGTAPESTPVTETSNTVLVDVPAEPDFTIEKLQEIEGSAAGFTKSVLVGSLGQTVDYEILVKDTGNTALSFETPSDPNCGAMLPPGVVALLPGESVAYMCSHTLTGFPEAGVYTNTATATGTPPEGQGSPVTHPSNTVVVEPPPAPKNKQIVTCESVTWNFSGFPFDTNTVKIKIKVDGVFIYSSTFTFFGTMGSVTVPISLSPGHHEVTTFAQWNVHGIKGEGDKPVVGGVDC